MISQATQDKLLRLTGSFEGSGFDQVTGNFDGAGLSCGALQQCLGPGSLQPLFKEMLSKHEDVLKRIWPEQALIVFKKIVLGSKAGQMAWANTITDVRRKERVIEPWNGWLKTMLKTPEYIAIQRRAAEGVMKKAEGYCEARAFKSERALSLHFDIVTQNGSIQPKHSTAIMDATRTAAKQRGRTLTEAEQLEIVALVRASFSLPQWQHVVARRKLLIARGVTKPFVLRGKTYDGKVNGRHWDLAKEFDLTDRPYSAPAAPPAQVTPPAPQQGAPSVEKPGPGLGLLGGLLAHAVQYMTSGGKEEVPAAVPRRFRPPRW